MKTHCKNGHEFTPENTYWMQPSARKKLRRVCRACAKMRGQQWRAANPERQKENSLFWRTANRERRNAAERMRARARYSPEVARKKYIRLKYGLSAETYDKMWEKQRGLCAICIEPLTAAVCVDHDHVTGHVRELLCPACNQTLGFAKDNTARLRNAASYVEKHSQRMVA